MAAANPGTHPTVASVHRLGEDQALRSLGCDFYAAEGSRVNSPSAIIASSS